ncbi:MAG: Na/Pi symporter [Sedimenticolaceae bacterium]
MAAGVAIFLFGMLSLEEGFKAFTGGALDRLLKRATSSTARSVLFGVISTSVMQSSSLVSVITISFLSAGLLTLAAGQITYENALALAIGANVGTTITAILGSLSANEAGKRLAVAHLVFNIVTGAIAIAFIYQRVDVVSHASAMVGIADDDYTLKLAVFHSIFNLLGIIVMLPLLNMLVVWLEKLLPEKKPEVDQPMYLLESSEEFPATAVQAVRRETERVFQAATRIVITGLGLKKGQVLSDVNLNQVVAARCPIHKFDIDAMWNRRIKGIYSGIVGFISRTQFSRSDESSMRSSLKE